MLADWRLLKCATLLMAAICVFTLSLLNFSLAVFATVVCTPVLIAVRPTSNRSVLPALVLKFHPFFHRNFCASISQFTSYFSLLKLLVLKIVTFAQLNSTCASH